VAGRTSVNPGPARAGAHTVELLAAAYAAARSGTAQTIPTTTEVSL
jgi:hypothetical protein